MWIVAEIGCSHEGDEEKAKKLINNCAEAGFTHVKLQKRTPELCVPKSMWHQKKQIPYGIVDYIDYRHILEFNKYQYERLAKYANECGVILFASVSDIQSAIDLKDIGMTIVKIPSPKIVNKELLNYCRDNFEYRIMSTGMSTESEIEKAIDILQPQIINHSVSQYPTSMENLTMGYLKWLKNKYKHIDIGYSGHSIENVSSMLALWYGSIYIERHVCFNRGIDWISDNRISLQVNEYYNYVGRLLIEVSKIERYSEDLKNKRINELENLLPKEALQGNKERELLECEIEKYKSLRG
jgi:N-acetylneuraminate synthase